MAVDEYYLNDLKWTPEQSVGLNYGEFIDRRFNLVGLIDFSENYPRYAQLLKKRLDMRWRTEITNPKD